METNQGPYTKFNISRSRWMNTLLLKSKGQKMRDFAKGVCPRCGNTEHIAKDCPHIKSTCHFCQKTGQLQSVCLKKKKENRGSVKIISRHALRTVKSINSIPQLKQSVWVSGQQITFEVDTGAGDNFCSKDFWKKLGVPALIQVSRRYEVANSQPLPELGTFRVSASLLKDQEPVTLAFTVTDVNLFGRDAIIKLGVNVSALLGVSSTPGKGTIQNIQIITDTKEPKPDEELQQACRKLCGEFSELFKPELESLKEFQLEIKFKAESKPTFCKPHPVPFAILNDLNQAYDAGIAKGVWKPTQFNAYGTPVVPIRKKVLPGQPNGKIRVCGDYSVAINAQLETHRYPIPLPEDLMRKLSDGYGFSKIDLVDAYNQVLLGPESQKRLAPSTHRGVLLQLRLPFGISSAPGYFQEIMDQLTGDLKGVGTYFDDILVSGSNASEHLENLRALLQRLQDKAFDATLKNVILQNHPLSTWVILSPKRELQNDQRLMLLYRCLLLQTSAVFVLFWVQYSFIASSYPI